MRIVTLIAVLALGVIAAGSTGVIAAPDLSFPSSSQDKSAAVAQYGQANQNACRALANRHEKSEDNLAAKNRLTRSNRRSADRREVRRARQRGASQQEI